MGGKKKNAALQSLPIDQVLDLVTNSHFYHQGGGLELIKKIIRSLEAISTIELRDLLGDKLNEKSATELFNLINVIKSGLSNKTLNYRKIFKVILDVAINKYNLLDKPTPKAKIIPYKPEKVPYQPSEGGPMLIERGRGRKSSTVSEQYLINTKKKI